MPLPDKPKFPKSGGMKTGRLGFHVSNRDELVELLTTPDSGAKIRYERFWNQFAAFKIKMEVLRVPPPLLVPDLDHGVRSKWEANFARWCIANGVEYDYEAVKIRLPRQRVYHPDFWIKRAGIWVEVKGLWMRGAYRLIEEFLDAYPEQKLLVLDREYYPWLCRGMK